MDNPNFSFIKDYGEEFYDNCCKVDFFIYGLELYPEAIVTARKIIEYIVAPEYEETLFEAIERKKETYSKKTLGYLHEIRMCANDFAHEIIDVDKDVAVDIAKKLHSVVIREVYIKRLKRKERIKDYEALSYDDEWIMYMHDKKEYVGGILSRAHNDLMDILKDNMEDMKEGIYEEMEEKFNKRIEEVDQFILDKYGITVPETIVPDEKQLEAIEFWDEENNNLIIKAGPGSGKTFVLVERVKFLINVQKVSPDSILLITFTNKAASQLKDRLYRTEGLNQSDIDHIHVSTIHGFCKTILKKYCISGTEIIDDDNNEKKVMYLKNNRERLGLDKDKYGFIPNDELHKVAQKFDEYDSFKVNIEDLIEYIKVEFKLDQENRRERKFKEFVDEYMEKNGEFPVEEVKENNRHKDRWTAHKFLVIAETYKKYHELIEEEHVFDFNKLQDETKIYLEGNRDKVKFKNILVDEFQDTDRIQMEIFDLLREGSESMTFVGDPDQSIFSWRGSEYKLFNETSNRDDFTTVNLNVNYRTPKNIVDFNETFMASKRGALKNNLKAKNDSDGDLYYIDNQSLEEEAKSIVEFINFLIENQRIQSLSEIAIISNSVKNKTELISELNNNGIDFAIKGFRDFDECQEVKDILFLLWYLTNEMKENEDINKDLLFAEDLDEEDIENKLFNLSEDTLKVIKEYPDFRRFTKLDEGDLKYLNIEGHDLEFLTKLNNLKLKFHNANRDEIDFHVLNLFYELLGLTNYVDSKYDILTSETEESIKNKPLLNLSLISRKIQSYMDLNDDFDIDGLFDYLVENYKEFSSPANDLIEDDKVHILTAHKSKGLEFPIVIVSSILEGSFPRDSIIKEDYKTPLNILKAREYGDLEGDITLNNKENELLLEEQNRVLYVALTRTKSVLLLSKIGYSTVMDELAKNTDIKELNLSKFKYFTKEPSQTDEDIVRLSFSSMDNYKRCPHLYNLSHNYNFVTPQNEHMIIGSVAHGCLENFNTQAIDGPVGEEDLDEIIKTAIDSNPSLEGNEKFSDVTESLYEYGEMIEDEEWKVLESEYPFTIFRHNQKENIRCELNGVIDLIINEDPEDSGAISLIDYKTSATLYNNVDYIKQLHLYAMAIEDNPNYGDKLIKNLIVYPLTNAEDYFGEKVSISKKEELEEQIFNTARNVSNKKYKKTDHKLNCKYCSFKAICDKGKEFF